MNRSWIFSYFLFILAFSVLIIKYTAADVHCFTRVHRERPGDTSLCKGLKKRPGAQLYKNYKRCCREGGVGYADALEDVGIKGNKFKCSLCEKSKKLKPFVLNSTSTTYSPTTTIRYDLIISTNITGWSEWGPWTECSLTCGTGIKRRQRLCHGKCDDEEPDMEVHPCSVISYCPVDGSWGPWEGWAPCTTSCGGGVQKRERRCNDPPPSHGGNECKGLPEEAVPCAINECPVDGNWSEWQNETSCSATCGKGIMRRTRQCSNPTPKAGGKDCEGRSEENIKCDLPRCPIHGDWSLWSKWTNCDVTCGHGKKMRSRVCNAPAPRFGGMNCTGDAIEYEPCFSRYLCPVDGGWSDWSPWGSCLAVPCKGEKGNQTRTRTCTNPLPRYGGSMCTGISSEWRECFNNNGCPVDGSWCEWSKLTACLTSDKGKFRQRTRECFCPYPESGGRLCAGDDFEVEACNIRPNDNPCSKLGVREGSGLIDDEDC